VLGTFIQSSLIGKPKCLSKNEPWTIAIRMHCTSIWGCNKKHEESQNTMWAWARAWVPFHLDIRVFFRFRGGTHFLLRLLMTYNLHPKLKPPPPKKSLLRPIGIPKFLIASKKNFFQFRSYGILLYVLIATFVYLNLEQRSCCHKMPIETCAPSNYLLFIYLFIWFGQKSWDFIFS
jgi:hypothetical protein